MPILRHRLILNFAAQSEGITVDEVIRKLCARRLRPWRRDSFMFQSFRVQCSEGGNSMATIQRFGGHRSLEESSRIDESQRRATCKPNFSRDFALRDQIRSAVVSVMSNIAEGYEREGTRRFQFLSIAKGLAGDKLRSQLYIA